MSTPAANAISFRAEPRAYSRPTEVAPSAPGGGWSPSEGRIADSPRTKSYSPRRLSDAEIVMLVSAAGAGDKASWDTLVDHFNGLIWAVVRAHRLGDADAADVVQVTWLRLVERLSQLHNPARVGSWLATTARGECLRILKTNKRQVLIGDEVVDEESLVPPPEESLVQRESHHAIRRAVSQLPERDRALLRLLTAEPSLSYEEISTVLAMPIGSIGRTRERALARLRRALESTGG